MVEPIGAGGPVAGLMVGTSLDGIDAVVVTFGDLGPRIESFRTVPFRELDPVRLRELAGETKAAASEFSALAVAAARDHAHALQSVDPDRRARLVGAHGITVAHAPHAERGHGWQLLDGAALAALSGRQVACDFRSADISLGGQGAPLAPLADLALRTSADEDRIVLNLGGIANFSALPAGARVAREVYAGDTGPANLALDAWVRRASGGRKSFDEGGDLALGGAFRPDVVEELLQNPWFLRPRPKSGGREQFGEAWLDRFSSLMGNEVSDADALATLVEVSARSVARELDRLPQDWRRSGRLTLLVTGGGRHNRAIMQRLEALLPAADVAPIETIGEDGDAKEAVDFAWLAVQRVLERPLELAPVTGARANGIAGALYLPAGSDRR